MAKGTKSVAIWYENVTHMLTTDSLALHSDPYAIFFTRSIKLHEASLREATNTFLQIQTFTLS